MPRSFCHACSQGCATSSSGSPQRNPLVRRIFCPTCPSNPNAAFCGSKKKMIFLGEMGPANFTLSSPVNVGPHPHIGLCTLTYLFEGAVLHRDSTGAERTILPGEVNFMIAGRGVTHSERGREVTHLIPETANGAKVMHGLQMWVALQKEQEDCEPSFGFATEGVPILEDVDGVDAQLMLGSALGKTQSALDATQPLF
eukprot:m.136715 g.136715  ORF g.136715 m.136715 type:complete len:198 (-) comp13956_c0_seq1:501-1094(-)